MRCSLFGAFKEALNTELQQVSRALKLDVLEMFDFWSVLRNVYKVSFTQSNIYARFLRTGLWPLDPTNLLGVPLTRSSDDSSHVLTVIDLENIIEAKRMSVRDAVLGCNFHVTASRFFDRTQGAVLTYTEALDASRDQERCDSKKHILEQVEGSRKAMSAARRLTAENKSIYKAERAR